MSNTQNPDLIKTLNSHISTFSQIEIKLQHETHFNYYYISIFQLNTNTEITLFGIFIHYKSALNHFNKLSNLLTNFHKI